MATSSWKKIAIFDIGLALLFKPQKTKDLAVQEVETPEAKEGRPIRKIYGTLWIDDPQILGFKRIGTDRIRSKGSKK